MKPISDMLLCSVHAFLHKQFSSLDKACLRLELIIMNVLKYSVLCLS